MDQLLGNRRRRRFHAKDLTLSINGKSYRIFNINEYGVGFLIDAPDEIELGTPIAPMTVNGHIPIKVLAFPNIFLSSSTLRIDSFSNRVGFAEQNSPPNTILRAANCWQSSSAKISTGKIPKSRNHRGWLHSPTRPILHHPARFIKDSQNG